ncbi:acyltransferase [Dyella monticola]|uniref:Acyltransferase n=1 Tax=Dyella monticola TaxID=1927958 RepID=A0A370X8D5_9GAMM|nr:acyltransferase family protein [Dyella monticola]RDS84537.1 acyltransferase [Dyella monticola]
MSVQCDDYRLGYRGDIEGLRALAILLVIGAHAAVPGFSGGFVGVDAFFVLSGFLITGLLIQEFTKTGSLSFTSFYIRRLRRLLPALIAMLLVCSALAALVLVPNTQISQAMSGLSATAWLSNVHFAFQKADYFSPGTETNIYLHTWSLGVEEQFYLVWPVLIYVVLRKSAGEGLERLRGWMLAVAVLSLTACIVATYGYPQLAFYMMPLRAWQFSMGALVWLEFRERSGWLFARIASAGVSATLGWLGLLMILGSGCLLNANKPYPGFYAVIPTAGAALVLATGSIGQAGGAQRLLSVSPLQSIGRISYSWYLWHWPMLLLGYALVGSHAPVCRIACIAASLILAIVSYRFVESPIRKQRWWMIHQRFAFYTALSVMLLSAVTMLHWYASAVAASHSPGQQRIAASHGDAPVIYAMGCDDWYRSATVRPCVFGDAHATHTAVLLGDSIAGQWFPAVWRVFDRPDWRLVVFTKSSCPMADQSFFYARIGRVYRECDTWRKAVVQRIVQMRPDVVLMSSVVNSAVDENQWANSSRRIIQPLSEAADAVYVLRATPHLPFDGPDCLAGQSTLPRWLLRGRPCASSAKDEHADTVYTSLEEASKGLKNVHLLDMNDDICPNELCAAELNGTIVFRDSQHMTATFAASLAPVLITQLQISAEPYPAKASLGK